MQEFEALQMVDRLRERGVNAAMHTSSTGRYGYGIRIILPDSREAIWDSDGTAGLEAQVMRNGMLVGFVPRIEGSEHFDEDQVIDAIVRTDYDKPIATQRKTAPPPAPPLRRHGGLFRRFLGGFREH